MKLTKVEWIVIALIIAITVVWAVATFGLDGGKTRLLAEGCKLVKREASTIGSAMGNPVWFPGKACFKCPDGREECVND